MIKLKNVLQPVIILSLRTINCVFPCVRSQKQVNVEEYGPTMADLEKQVAAHNILHKEIEAYNSQLCVSSAGSKVNKRVYMKTHSQDTPGVFTEAKHCEHSACTTAADQNC